MSNVDDGGPAFPHTVTTGADGGQHFPLDYALAAVTIFIKLKFYKNVRT